MVLYCSDAQDSSRQVTRRARERLSGRLVVSAGCQSFTGWHTKFAKNMFRPNDEDDDEFAFVSSTILVDR